MAEEPKKSKIDLREITIKPFDPKPRRAAFSCGQPNIDNFLRKSAEDQHKKYQCRVYYAVHGDKIVGFYSLAAASRDPRIVSEGALKKFERILSTPCIYLGMIGVQSELQDCGIGKLLMIHAMETTLKVADLIGVYALILDARNAEVAARYQKWGFEFFIEGELAMYIPLGTMRNAVQPPAKASAKWLPQSESQQPQMNVATEEAIDHAKWNAANPDGHDRE